MRWIGLVVLLLVAVPAVGQDTGLGEEIFRRCAMCHDIGPAAANRQGPHLNNLFGRRAASLVDFPYSAAMRQARENGLIWTRDTIAQFIAKPKHFEPGTGMIFPGLKNSADVDDVVAYLGSLQTEEEIVLQTGAALVELNCAGCHAIGHQGASLHPQAPPFRELHERYDVTDLIEGLVEGFSSGHPDMPEFVFAEDEATAIVAYIKSLE